MKHPNNIPWAKRLLASIAFLTLGWGQAMAQDAKLFERVEDDPLRECFRKRWSTCRRVWFWT